MCTYHNIRRALTYIFKGQNEVCALSTKKKYSVKDIEIDQILKYYLR